MTPAQWVAGANGFTLVLLVCRQDHGVLQQDREAAGSLSRERGSCLRMQIPAGLGPSSAGLCEMSLKNVLFKIFWKENMPDHFYLKDKKRRKKKEEKKRLYESVLHLRKKVLTPLPPPAHMVLSHSDPPNSCRSIPLRKPPSELWRWLVPLLHYLILCWQSNNFPLPVPTSWLLLVE